MFHQAPGQVDANLVALEECVARLAASGADLVVTPECFLCGYGAGSTTLFRRVSAVAKQYSVTIVCDFAELADDGVIKDLALNWVNADGIMPFMYRKTHLWVPSSFESTHFQQGTESLSPMVELKGVRIGALT